MPWLRAETSSPLTCYEAWPQNWGLSLLQFVWGRLWVWWKQSRPPAWYGSVRFSTVVTTCFFFDKAFKALPMPKRPKLQVLAQPHTCFLMQLLFRWQVQNTPTLCTFRKAEKPCMCADIREARLYIQKQTCNHIRANTHLIHSIVGENSSYFFKQ